MSWRSFWLNVDAVPQWTGHGEGIIRGPPLKTIFPWTAVAANGVHVFCALRPFGQADGLRRSLMFDFTLPEEH